MDPLLMKLIRNLSCSPDRGIRIAFKRHLHELLGMAKASESQQFLVEALGAISNLSYLDTAEIVPYHELLVQYDVVDWITKLLSVGNAVVPSMRGSGAAASSSSTAMEMDLETEMEDDLLVAILMLIGCFAASSKSCALLADPRLMGLVLQHIAGKLDDEEIALQAIYTVFSLLLHRESRECLCREPRCIPIIQQLAKDSNDSIRSMAANCLDIVVDFGDEYSERVRAQRFYEHNREWILFVESLSENGNANGSGIRSDRRNQTQNEHEDDDDDVEMAMTAKRMRLRPTSPNELVSLLDDGDDDGDLFLDDAHSSMQYQWQNMHFISECSDDDDDSGDLT